MYLAYCSFIGREPSTDELTGTICYSVIGYESAQRMGKVDYQVNIMWFSSVIHVVTASVLIILLIEDM